MKTKFKCGDIVQYKTQPMSYAEPFTIITIHSIESLSGIREVFYSLNNSHAGHRFVDAKLFEIYVSDKNK